VGRGYVFLKVVPFLVPEDLPTIRFYVLHEVAPTREVLAAHQAVRLSGFEVSQLLRPADPKEILPRMHSCFVLGEILRRAKRHSAEAARHRFTVWFMEIFLMPPLLALAFVGGGAVGVRASVGSLLRVNTLVSSTLTRILEGQVAK